MQYHFMPRERSLLYQELQGPTIATAMIAAERLPLAALK